MTPAHFRPLPDHEGLRLYFDKLYERFESVLQCLYPHVSASQLYDTVLDIASGQLFDAAGSFVRTEINAPSRLPAALLLYLAGAHLLVDQQQRQEFILLYGYYKIKKAVVSGYGMQLNPFFDYLSHLLQYGKKMLLHKPITHRNRETWNIIMPDREVAV